ncbi:unnamed protein product [Brassica rapa subsp. trilocularis]
MRYAVGSALVCYCRFKVKMRDLFFLLKRGQNLVIFKDSALRYINVIK